MSSDFERVLENGGEAGALIRSVDWSRHPLGPVEGWPRTLKTALGICLASRSPILVWWGSELFEFYNDAYRPVLGASKHPRAMGARGDEIWPEIWHIMRPIFEGLLAGGPSVQHRDMFMFLDRYGFAEETYFDHAHCAILGDSGEIAGIFTTVTETTPKVLYDRRLRTLKALAEVSGVTRDVGETCRRSADALLANARDVPACRIFLRLLSRLEAVAGAPIVEGSAALIEECERVMTTGEPRLVDLPLALPPVEHGTLAPSRAFVLPIRGQGDEREVEGVCLAALSPHLPFDDHYKDFLSLAANQIGASVASARAHEEQARRLAALEEIDRAKTTFFSNVSHELRTPLTLILGPVGDALASPRPALAGEALVAVNRNAQRLLRLVGMLLDFSRIEAGRMEPRLVPTDLAELTADVASSFRSAFARAGLSFEVDCAPLGAPVAVDRDMWEKIISNLLSNALKFTLDGGVTVTLREEGGVAILSIRDSGTGIEASQLPRIFERFYRVPNARGRSHEGTGIGLALSHDFVRLLGGEISVTSEVGRGSELVVKLPMRSGRAASASGAAPWAETSPRSAPFEEAWLTGAAARLGPSAVGAPSARRVLVVDDNQDMRDYLARLLSGTYEVEVLANGAAALASALASPPSLVLADVMMPELDGFGLIAGLRADPRTRDVPVILVSARAGEEARIEGVSSGADDYIVKPFVARELLARVAAQVQLGRARAEARDARDRIRAAFEQAPVAVSVVRGPDFVFELANPPYEQMVGRAGLVGKKFRDAFPELTDDAPVLRMLKQVLESGESFSASEYPVMLRSAPSGELRETFFLFTCRLMREPSGENSAIVTVAVDVTEQAQMRRRIEALSSEREQLLAKEQRARSEAEGANRAKDEFLAMLGHELRNPLAPILTALELLRQRGEPLEREHVVIERQVGYLRQLVDDLLDVARVTRGKLDLKRRRTEIREVVAKAVEVAAPLFETRRHHLVVDVPAEGLAVVGDAQRLAQVVANLLVNAAKYTDPGGHISITAGAFRGHVILRVKDDGVGIEPDFLPHVFDSFVQERQSIDRSRGGLGLGLTIVKNVVELHGGTVSAESRGKGLGSVFSVSLPLDEGGATHQEPAPEPPPPTQRRARRILIVDDNVDAAELLGDWFIALGDEVRLEHDGPAALAAASAFLPEIGLIDIGLPGMDGFEVAQRLRATDAHRGMLLVAVTGYGQASDRERSARSGFDLHLVKPIDVTALDKTLTSLAANARAR